MSKNHCSCEILHSNTNHLILIESDTPYVKVMSYLNTTLVLTSHHYYETINKYFLQCTKDQLFELPFVYGITLHYVYQTHDRSSVDFEIIDDKIGDYIEFSNAVDKQTTIICVKKENGKVIGVAGASILSDHLYEIGVDVIEEARNQGLASQMVQFLADYLISLGKMVIYSASVTNIASQKVTLSRKQCKFF